MKFSISSALAFVSIISSTASAGQGSLGFNLGVARSFDGACKDTADYNNDFKILAPYTDTVRIYASSDCFGLQNIIPALQAHNFKAFLGIWPNEDIHFASEIASLKINLPKISVDNVKGFIVGSETIFRNEMTPDQLLSRIRVIKQTLSSLHDKNGKSFSTVPVGIADTWNVLIDGRNHEVLREADIVLANAFSYWQAQSPGNASYSFVDDVMQILQTYQTVKNSTNVQFWVGETGWPTDGTQYQVAVPNVTTAAKFWQEAVCAIRSWGINTLIFEAFDEAWKPDTSNTPNVEKHWGIFDHDGTPKYDLTCHPF